MAIQIDFVYPNERPDQCPEVMWDLQVKLDACAQQLFGKRNPSKELLRPEFVKDGPHVRNTIKLDGGFAELSLNAAGYWPTAIYELAHETIHLLDPRPGHPLGKGASWLEEGLAVNFSIAISKAIGDQSIKVSHKKYQIANGLFTRIGGDLFHRAMEIRSRSGHFSDANTSDILAVSPGVPQHIAEKLVSSFYS
ncbi:hypothetical protein D3C76_767140 [compost metagenome]|uniref:hypothetical protein n=1 Tax=Pseudomonas sp. BF-R-30 TaxID=2832384 RepID=UPI000F92EC8E|nr:hypothetical protein [Pseudomonas sp. BF-R-30]